VSGDVYYAEFNWDHMMQKRKKYLLEYREIARFPSVRRDLSMLLDKQVSFEELKKIALQTEKYLLKEVQVFDVYEGDKIPQGKKSYALSFILQDEEKTLNDKQIDSVIDKLIRNYEEKAGAEIRKA
jgi:phenylalanyl-tRNA synthetase beta chain